MTVSECTHGRSPTLSCTNGQSGRTSRASQSFPSKPLASRCSRAERSRFQIAFGPPRRRPRETTGYCRQRLPSRRRDVANPSAGDWQSANPNVLQRAVREPQSSRPFLRRSVRKIDAIKRVSNKHPQKKTPPQTKVSNSDDVQAAERVIREAASALAYELAKPATASILSLGSSKLSKPYELLRHRLNGYLVLQGNIPCKISQIKHILKLPARKTTYLLG